MLEKLFSKWQKTESSPQEKTDGEYRMVSVEDLQRYEFQEKLFQTIASTEAALHNEEDPLEIAAGVIG